MTREDEIKYHDNRRVFTERQSDFDRLVEFEKSLIKERGYIQFRDDHGRVQRIYVGIRLENK